MPPRKKPETAFEKIEAGLKDAIDIAEGRAEPAAVYEPASGGSGFFQIDAFAAAGRDGPETFVMRAQERMMRAPRGAKIEVFSGDGGVSGEDWVVLQERRPDGVRVSGMTYVHAVPEGYVRADDDWVMLWPSLACETLFRITPPEEQADG